MDDKVEKGDRVELPEDIKGTVTNPKGIEVLPDKPLPICYSPEHIELISEEGELRSCPFCGGDAELIEPNMDSYSGHYWFVTCEDRGCPGSRVPDGEFRCVPNDFLQKQEAIDQWNSRYGENDEE